MQWIELGLVTPTVAQAVAAATNGLFFSRYATITPSPGRRAAAATLALLSGVFVLEAGLYLAFASLPPASLRAPETWLTLLARWAFAAVNLLLSLVVWRSPMGR